MTQTVTIMFTDIAGYTASVNSMQREDIRRLVERHEQIVTGFLRSKGGEVVKNLGDSYMIIFHSATEAIKAGMELLSKYGYTEQELYQIYEQGNSGLNESTTPRGKPGHTTFDDFDTIENDKTVPMSMDANLFDLDCEFPEEKTQEFQTRLPLRISCATGDVEKISSDYFGDSVNMSARILSKTPVGQFWFSYCSFMAMNQTEIPWETVGRFSFKGFYGYQKVFRAIPDDRVYLPEILMENILDGEVELFSSQESTPITSSKSFWVCLGCNSNSAIQNVQKRLPSTVNRNKIWFVGYQVPPTDRYAWQESGGNWLIGKDDVVQELLWEKMNNSQETNHSETIVMSRSVQKSQLHKQGIALPRMPYGDLLLGYKYYLNKNLQWNSSPSEAILQIEVSSEKIYIQSFRTNIWINQQPLPMEKKIVLAHDDNIQISKHTLQCFHLNSPEYCGFITGGHEDIFTISNVGTLIGRDPGPEGIVHPSPKNPSNMIWASGSQATNARKNGFTLERALVGRKQVHIYEQKGDIYVKNLHDHCSAYILERDSNKPYILNDTLTIENQTRIFVGRECFLISSGKA